MSTEKIWYVYLHTNGKLIWKNEFSVGNPLEYFDSSFVRKWWRIKVGDKPGALQFLREAAELGSSTESIDKIEKDWHITKADYMSESSDLNNHDQPQ